VTAFKPIADPQLVRARGHTTLFFDIMKIHASCFQKRQVNNY